MPSLVVESGKDKGLAVELCDDRVFLIGRGSSCDLHLSDTLASRHHCWVECRDRKFVLKDGGSRNGSFLNGRRVSEAELMSGDQILIGETLITFQAEATASTDPLIGKDIGGYRILELIGKGGMGRVYKAMQISLERVVAIKILSRQYATNAAFIERFRREAMALARLTHPNIVSVYDVGESGGFHYFSMEYMSGGTVADKISGGRKLPPEEAIPMMIDVARGLTYAEEQGVVHRDIKPENMMLDHAGNVKICDLGIAHTISEGPWRNTAHGVFGSPHYIAPEQARGETTDHRADIYSLGASFYRILAGKTLFTGGSARELIIKHISESPTPIAELEPAMSSILCKVIDRCIAKDLFTRYQSASKVVEDLEQALQQVRLATEAKERTVRSRKRRKGSRFILKTIVLLAVLASGTVAYFAVQHPDETRQVMDNIVQWISAHTEGGSGDR